MSRSRLTCFKSICSSYHEKKWLQSRMSRSFRPLLYAALCLLWLGNVACAKMKSSAPSTASSAPVSNAATQGRASSLDATRHALSAKKAPQRKVIQRAEMSLSIKTYAPFAKALREQLAQFQGYIADLRISRSVHRVSSVHAVIRVPSHRFEAFLGWLRRQGHVSYERITGEDITARYYDLQSRLRNQKRLEARLLQLLKQKTAKLKDVIEVERELARVREKIEQMEGQSKLWDRLVAMATLRLALYIQERYQPVVALTFGQKFSRTFSSSWREFGEFLQDLVIGISASLPWLLFFGVFIWLALWWWRRRKKRKQAAAAS